MTFNPLHSSFHVFFKVRTPQKPPHKRTLPGLPGVQRQIQGKQSFKYIHANCSRWQDASLHHRGPCRIWLMPQKKHIKRTLPIQQMLISIPDRQRNEQIWTDFWREMPWLLCHLLSSKPKSLCIVDRCFQAILQSSLVLQQCANHLSLDAQLRNVRFLETCMFWNPSCRIHMQCFEYPPAC